jgi:Flp pilus assembly protein TadD
MKKLTKTLCLTAMALCLTACGGKEKEISIDTSKLAEELLTTVTSDSLSETASDMLPSIYFYEADTVDSAIAYASSGATACEVAVIQSKDAQNTSEIEKLLQTRVDNQSSLYASYNEGEVEKLDDAIIKSTGVYTVLCVTDDADKANDILKEYGF